METFQEAMGRIWKGYKDLSASNLGATILEHPLNKELAEELQGSHGGLLGRKWQVAGIKFGAA